MESVALSKHKMGHISHTSQHGRVLSIHRFQYMLEISISLFFVSFTKMSLQSCREVVLCRNILSVEKLALIVVWLPNGELCWGTTVVVVQLLLCWLKELFTSAETRVYIQRGPGSYKGASAQIMRLFLPPDTTKSLMDCIPNTQYFFSHLVDCCSASVERLASCGVAWRENYILTSF